MQPPNWVKHDPNKCNHYGPGGTFVHTHTDGTFWHWGAEDDEEFGPFANKEAASESLLHYMEGHLSV